MQIVQNNEHPLIVNYDAHSNLMNTQNIEIQELLETLKKTTKEIQQNEIQYKMLGTLHEFESLLFNYSVTNQLISNYKDNKENIQNTQTNVKKQSKEDQQFQTPSKKIQLLRF